MDPLVSINCITYNHASYIKDALDGFVMQQTNFPFEVLLHDDASTDGTQDIIREYEKNYPNIFKVIYQKENQYSQGVRIVKEFQLPRAKGIYMAQCEGDDYWFNPNKLQMQFDYMEKHPECSCCFHSVICLDYSNGCRVTKCNQESFGEKDYSGDDIIGVLDIATCSMFYKTDLNNIWPKFREIADIGDFPQICLFATHGYFHYFPQVMGVYRWKVSGSWTESHKSSKQFSLENSLRALHWLYEFNIYSKRKFEVNVGITMMHYIIIRLEAISAITSFRWLEDIVIEAHGKKDKMIKFKEDWEKTGKKSSLKKLISAEEEYYAWFVERIGKDLDKLP